MTQDITNTVERFFAAIDACDWEGCAALMTNPFFLDYSSFGAGPGAEVSPNDVLSGWKAMLPGFDATHHQLGPLDIEVDGDDATVRAHVTGLHQISGAEGGEMWAVYGNYTLTLKQHDGWKLASITFHYKFLTGNTDLPELARSRVAAA